jgi:hypothetical protein
MFSIFCENLLHSRFWGVSDPLCISSSLAIHFSDYSFLVHHTLLTGMTAISLHMK